MKLIYLFFFCVFPLIVNGKYFLGKQGQSCFQVCLDQGLNCNANIQTMNSTLLFKQLGVNCTADPQPWWAEDQPSFVSDPSDGNYGKV